MDEDELLRQWERTLPLELHPDQDPGLSVRPQERDTSGSWLAELSQLSSFSVGGEGTPERTLPHPPPEAGDETLLEAVPPPGPRPGAVGTPGSSYELIEEVGRGGMGVVWRAKQSSLQRDVAVKKAEVPRELDEAQSRTLNSRFVAEALVTGVLDHPNIVPVHDLGQGPTGEILLAMKLIDGTSWKAVLHPKTAREEEVAGKYDLGRHLQVLLSVTNAMAFAHSKGIVHNDLKPENVMLGEFGEVFVMDWGLAVRLPAFAEPKGAPGRESIQAPCGTPAYMPPELAMGRGDQVGTWTDTYLLGAILYELITGKAPHRGKRLRDVITAAAHSVPPQFPPETPAELRSLCRRALAKDPEERYQSVASFQKDLQAFLQHRESTQIEATARALLERCREAPADAPRNELYADFSEAVAGFRQAQVLWTENLTARESEAEARLAFASAALDHDDLGLAHAQLAHVAETHPTRKQLDQRAQDAEASRARAQRQARRLRWGLVAALATIVVGLTTGAVLIEGARRRAERLRERAEAEHHEAEAQRQEAEAQRAVAVSQRQEAETQRQRAEASEHAAAEEAQRAKVRLAQTLVAQGDMLGLDQRWPQARQRYHEAQSLLRELGQSTLSADLGLWTADHHAPPPLQRVAVADDVPLHALAFGPSGRWLIVPGPGGALERRDAITGRLLERFAGHPGGVTDVTVSRTGQWVLSAGADGRAHLWASGQADPVRILDHKEAVLAVDVSYDGTRAATVDSEGVVRVWEIPRGRMIAEMRGHEGPVYSVRFAPNGQLVVSGGEDGIVRCWNVNTQEVWGSHDVHQGPVRSVDFSPQGGLVVSGGDDQLVCLWNLDAGWHRRSVSRYRGHQGQVLEVRFTPPGDQVISASQDGTLRLWSADQRSSRERIARIGDALGEDVRDELRRQHDFNQMREVERFLDRPFLELLERHLDPLLNEILDAGGYEVTRIVAHDGPVRAMAIAPGGQRCASLGDQGAHLWPLTPRGFPGPGSTEEARIFEDVSEAGVQVVGVDPAGRWGASAWEERGIRLWDLPTGRRLIDLPGHTEPLSSLRFAPEGRRLLSTGRDGRAIVWSLPEGAPRVLCELSTPILHADWDADGGRVVLGLADGRVRVLTLKDDEVGRLDCPALEDGVGVTAVSVGEDVAAVGYADGRVAVWDLTAQPPTARVGGTHEGPVRCVAYAPGRDLVASGGVDARIELWRVEDTLVRVAEFAGHAGEVRRVRFTPDDGLLVSASVDSTLKLWNVVEFHEVRSFGGRGQLLDLALARDGQLWFTGNHQGEVVLWDLARPALARTLQEAALAARAQLSADPDHADALADLARWHAFRGALDAAVELWDRAREGGASVSPKEIGRVQWRRGYLHAALTELQQAPRDEALVLALETLRRDEPARGSILGNTPGIIHTLITSVDGREAFSGDSEGVITRWDLRTGLRRANYSGHTGRVHDLSLVPGGERLLSGGDDQKLRIWDVASGRLLQVLEGFEDTIVGVHALGDGKALVLTHDGVLRRVDLDAQTLEDLHRVGHTTSGMRVNAEGLVLVFDWNQLERLSLSAPGQRRRVPVEDAPDALVFSPDGALLYVGQNMEVQILDPESGTHRRLGRSQRRGVNAIDVSADEQWLVCGTSDGEILVFDLEVRGPPRSLSIPQLILEAVCAEQEGVLVVGARSGELRVFRLEAP